MQNREELGQKGHNGSRKMTCHERGENIIFRRGGGINIVFGPKYRPLLQPFIHPLNDLKPTTGSRSGNPDPVG
jgi:hypothetical protein